MANPLTSFLMAPVFGVIGSISKCIRSCNPDVSLFFLQFWLKGLEDGFDVNRRVLCEAAYL